MKSRVPSKNLFFFTSLILIGAVAVLGCGKTNPTKTLAEYNATNIQKVRNSYSMYATVKGGPPKDKASLLSFLKEDAGAKIRLERMGINPATVDEIFTSERDGEPFVIRWGVGGPKDHAIVFEAVGVEGKRMAAFFEPRELEQEEYESLLKGNPADK